MPRHKGSISCQHMESAVSPSCQKMARVVTVVRRPNAQGGYSEMRYVWCWEHYLELEEKARHSSTLEVVSAELLYPESE